MSVTSYHSREVRKLENYRGERGDIDSRIREAFTPKKKKAI